MELNTYQAKAIDDLKLFLEFLNKEQNISLAYKSYWESKDVPAIPPYYNELPGVPNVCFKVPTGGGKTFMAAASILPIFEAIPLKNKAVVWLAPSDTILTQTYENLTNPAHPYRIRLQRDFCGAVEVYNKQQAQMGQNFSPAAVGEQLSVFALSYDSFRTSNKEGRKAYQANGNLEGFGRIIDSESLLSDVDSSALIQAIRSLNPVVIVDESHHAKTQLSIDMLKNFNPSFVLELTATPHEKSNIITYVPARKLKDENMVKLPVIVYPKKSQEEVIESVIQMRNALEEFAKNEVIPGMPKIRPIALFQAETMQQGKEDRATFDSIKRKLIEKYKILEEEIAIKTANINEIKDVNLMEENCQIRYIITINALKEGWDCPFAYCLASLANRSSSVEVEQILGRILRRPYAMNLKNEFLNISYVFTASEDFRQTLDNIVTGLNNAGFSEKEYRVAPEIDMINGNKDTTIQGEFDFGAPSPANSHDTPLAQNKTERDNNDETKEENNEKTLASGISPETQNMLDAAKKGSDDYKQKEPISDISPEEHNKMTHFKISAEFSDALELVIPQFFIKTKEHIDLWGKEDVKLLYKEKLLKNFSLQDKDSKIDFSNLTTDMILIDVDDELPKYKKLTYGETVYFHEYFSKLVEPKKREEAINMMQTAVDRKCDSLASEDIRRYVRRIIENFDEDMLNKLAKGPSLYANRIIEKIQSLMEIYAKKEFENLLDAKQIFCRPSYRLPKEISPLNYTKNIRRSLYEAEDYNMNDFEYRVIMDIASQENILWWHRNVSQKGFCINGFINHYPDFLAMTKSGVLLAIETKGDDRDNSDSRMKIDLGKAWARESGGKFAYFMVFDKKEVGGAYKFEEFLRVIREM